MNARLVRTGIAAVLFVLAVTSQAASAYTVPHGSRDMALLNYHDDGVPLDMYMSLTSWGTTYYSGLPPQEQGGLGTSVLCLDLYRDGLRGGSCFDATDNFVFDRLQSLVLEDHLPVNWYDGDENLVASEQVDVVLTLTGTGLPYPGIGARTNPSPGAEGEVSFLRDVSISGSLHSDILGNVDLATGAAVIAADDCIGFLAAEDNVEACRF